MKKGKLILQLNNNEGEIVEIENTLSTKEKGLFEEGDFKYYSLDRETLKIKSTFFNKNKRVRDVWRYNLVRKGNKYKLDDLDFPECPFCLSVYVDKNPPKGNKNICLIIIESPHKHEYKFGTAHLPVAPAQKGTGARIHNQLENKINDFNSNNKQIFTEPKYQVVICNPIQFQTSLYALQKPKIAENYGNLKEKVWNAIYEFENKNGIAESFLKRIGEYSPKIIINSCTESFRQTIEDQIQTVFYKTDIKYFYTLKHPSYWDKSIKLFLNNLMV